VPFLEHGCRPLHRGAAGPAAVGRVEAGPAKGSRVHRRGFGQGSWTPVDSGDGTDWGTVLRGR